MEYKEVCAKYEKMIHKIVNSFPYFVREDLIQEGYLALYRAYLSYDPKVASFSTYVYSVIRRSCCNYMRDKARTVRLPARLAEKGKIIHCVGMNAPEEHRRALEETLGSEEVSIDIDDRISLVRMLKILVSKGIISLYECTLLRRRFFDEMTLEEIGKEDGTTKVTIRTRIEKVIKILRPYFAGTKVISKRS